MLRNPEERDSRVLCILKLTMGNEGIRLDDDMMRWRKNKDLELTLFDVEGSSLRERCSSRSSLE